MTTIPADWSTRYQEDGLVFVEGVLTEADVQLLRDRLAEIAAGRVPGFPVEKIEFEPGTDKNSQPAVRKINECAQIDVVFMRVARDRRVLDLVELLIGPDIKLYGSQCFMKPPGGVEKPYHQDSAYFTIDPPALVTCWIALDDVTQENGCLWVIPGSHRGGLVDHSQPWQVGDRIDRQVPDDCLDRTKERPITMPAGSCSFHHSKLLHRSGPNQTDQPRRGLAIHYMSSCSRWTNPEKSQPKYALLRGREYEGCV